MKTSFNPLILILLLISITISAQPKKELITVLVSPNHSNWLYNTDENAEFSITVLENNVPLNGIEVDFKIEPDSGMQFLKILDEGKTTLKNGSFAVKTKTIIDPSFIRCTASMKVNGKVYSSYATVGFLPQNIKPTTTLPSDFKSFWDDNLKALAKIPINYKMEYLAERSTSKVDVYEVSFDNISGKIYGVL